jgi:hypothetical protein
MTSQEFAKLTVKLLEGRKSLRVADVTLDGIPVIFVEDKDGTRHHVRFLDVRGRENYRFETRAVNDG